MPIEPAAGVNRSRATSSAAWADEIEQLLLEHPLDAVPGAVDRADGGELSGGLDNAPQAAVDDRGWPAALGNDQVPRNTHDTHLGTPTA